MELSFWISGRRIGFLAAVLGAGLAGAAQAASAPSAPPPADAPVAAASAPAGFPPERLPEGAAKARMGVACTACHSLDRILRTHQTADAWSDTVSDMLDKGADVSPDDLPALLDYLGKNLGADSAFAGQPDGSVKLNLNLATAAQIQGLLAVSADQAAAVVQFREQHGKFSGWDDLIKVPGLDAVALAPVRDLLAY